MLTSKNDCIRADLEALEESMYYFTRKVERRGPFVENNRIKSLWIIEQAIHKDE